MLALDGNTAPYLLYAVTRVHSIFRKITTAPETAVTEAAATPPATPEELALARKLTKFPDAINLAAGTLRPHFLCLYLYELAGEFSTFYAADKGKSVILVEQDKRLGGVCLNRGCIPSKALLHVTKLIQEAPKLRSKS